MASDSRSGSSPRLSAICGSEVVSTVESSWLMNMPVATTHGTMLVRGLVPGPVRDDAPSALNAKTFDLPPGAADSSERGVAEGVSGMTRDQ